MGYIYKITNNINNKQYIGQTIKKRPSDRFSQHRYAARHPESEKHPPYLHKAMAKYGVENFSFEIIEEVENSKLNIREQWWISQLNTLSPNGYNLTIGGEGTQGFSRPQTIEEREKRQQSNKSYYAQHPEIKQQIGERTKKLWENEEYRKKVTDGNKLFAQNHPNLNKGSNNPMYGKHHTEEALKKIRDHAATQKTKIIQLNKDTLEEIQVFDGIRDAEKALGVSHGWISKAAKANKIAYGYRWKIV